MSLSRLPLSYCTNVHPGRSVAEVEDGLDRYTVPIRQSFGKPLAAGLWLADPVVRELVESPQRLSRFAAGLVRRGLTCHTLNAFPFGDFHSVRVKEQVYLPDWSQPQRAEYTERCATVLAALLPDDGGTDGSISTVPLGFGGFDHPDDFVDQAARRLIDCARGLERIYCETGKRIRLAIEPEPLCVLETTEQTLRFFDRLWQIAETDGALPAAREHLGVCYDVCHQAVEFEDAGRSIRALDSAGIRLNKIHISSALQLDHPADNPEGRSALRRYVEPRYLHQTFARAADGRILRQVDLTEEFLSAPGPEFLAAPSWRIHFHVPVNADRLGPLGTTRPALADALRAVAGLRYAPHLEVETYTWEVLPGAGPTDLIAGLGGELKAADELIANAGAGVQA